MIARSLSLVLLVCGCLPPNNSDAGADAGIDASSDAGSDAGSPSVDAGELPFVVPSGLTCPPDAGTRRDCVPEGWFALSRWSSWEQPGYATDGGTDRSPVQAVYLDPFIIDRFEVTNAEWLEFVHDGGAAAPPAACGCSLVDPEQPLSAFDEFSGWDGGEPDPNRLSHPVVCVTRREAMSFCQARGGRLPSLVEAMKAARGPHPDTRMFPWGFAPLTWLPTGSLAVPPGYQSQYNAINLRDLDKLNTVPVGSRSLGAGPYGTLDLAGNVSEFALDCLEAIPAVFPSGNPVIRPTASWSPVCGRASVVFGNNWYSTQGFGMTAFRFSYYVDYLGSPDCDSSWNPLCRELSGLLSFGEAHCTTSQPPIDTPANERRSWSVGFRCAYPVQ